MKQAKKTRMQFLILQGEPILAFVGAGMKFTDCESYKDVTSSVTCKVRRLWSNTAHHFLCSRPSQTWTK